MKKDNFGNVDVCEVAIWVSFYRDFHTMSTILLNN